MYEPMYANRKVGAGHNMCTANDPLQAGNKNINNIKELLASRAKDEMPLQGLPVIYHKIVETVITSE